MATRRTETEPFAFFSHMPEWRAREVLDEESNNPRVQITAIRHGSNGEPEVSKTIRPELHRKFGMDEQLKGFQRDMTQADIVVASEIKSVKQ